jgi:hypothetical protein
VQAQPAIVMKTKKICLSAGSSSASYFLLDKYKLIFRLFLEAAAFLGYFFGLQQKSDKA